MRKLISAGASAVVLTVSAFAGERLYNGIVLPDAWPPRHFSTLTREPQPVPYLRDRPATVPIDIGRQLFVDDFLVERTDLRRVWHYPKKYEGNPILKPETPAEINRPSNSSTRGAAGGIWWDPTRKVFRCWYEAGWLNRAAYAESDDGLVWRRVNLDVVPGTNLILPEEGRMRLDGWVVTPDFGTAEPYANWRLFARPPGPQSQPSYVATSPDGIHWSKFREAGRCGDATLLFHNPFRSKWIFSIRSELGPWGKGGSRVRSYREAADFLSGVNWDFKINESTDDVVLWLQPSRYDQPDPLLKLPPQLYTVAGTAYESVMVGTFSIWKGPENSDLVRHGMPKINDLCFAFSRDGFHFDRPDLTPAIASERWASRRWDAGYVLGCPSVLAVCDEKLLFYYSGCAGNPKRLEKGGFTMDLCGCYDQMATGVAMLRRDGFASFRTGLGLTAGELVTRPVVFSGRHLFVNADLGAGTLRAEVLDADGSVVPGYAAADSTVVTGDTVKASVRWRQAADLGPLAGMPVRFRFVLTAEKVNVGDFYSFWVSASPRGESKGYLGAGGPAYNGVRDL